MLLVVAFLLRLSGGLAAAMAIVPTRHVPAGYYRVHSYVLLGLSAAAALAAATGLPAAIGGASGSETLAAPLWLSVVAGGFGYLSVVAWHFQRPRPGLACLVVVAAAALAGAARLSIVGPGGWPLELLRFISTTTSSLLLGLTFAAMFLGHYYLNTPAMRIEPLRRLVALLGAATVLHAIVCGVAWGIGLSQEPFSAGMEIAGVRLMLAILRWLAGLAGTLGLVGMTWSTLKIPNTQAATGMLYVAVITTLLGELAGMLLSEQARLPL